MRTLTPEDIKRENAYRTAQRKAGKSRKGNIKDPNAPKKPLSAFARKFSNELQRFDLPRERTHRGPPQMSSSAPPQIADKGTSVLGHKSVASTIDTTQ